MSRARMVEASLILIGCTVAPIHRVSSTAPDEGAAVVTKQMEVTEIASQTPPYAIFASHRQMIVSNAQGIFVVYSDSNTDGPNADQAHAVNFTWVLQRSVDGLAPYANDPCSWLQSFLPRNGKIHFMFQAGQKKHQLYERFNIGPFGIDLRLDNNFKGTNFNLFGFDGFFTRSELPNSPISSKPSLTKGKALDKLVGNAMNSTAKMRPKP